MSSHTPLRPFETGANGQPTVQWHGPGAQRTPLPAAAVNPSALRKTGKWLVPALATVLVGQQSSESLKYKASKTNLLQGVTASKFLEAGVHSTAPRTDPYQDQNNSLMDSYGDKMTLDDIEKAVAAYEARRRGG